MEHDQVEAISILADFGIDCMSIVVEPNSDTLLHIAAKQGSENVARYVLDKWPSLFCRTSVLGRFPLHDACEHGKANIVRLFLNHAFPRSLLIVQQSPFGCYEFPIDINHVDSDSRTALLDACSSGSLDTVKALLGVRFVSVGNGISSLAMPITSHSPNNTSSTAGSLSSYVSSLFRRMRVPSNSNNGPGLPFSHSFQTGASTYAGTGKPGRSGSTISLEDRSGNTFFSDFEIVSPQPKPPSPGDAYCPVDLNVLSYDRSTPLLTAIRLQNVPIAAFLLQAGADPELPGNWRGYNYSPLHAAVELKNSDLVDLLLHNGAMDADCSGLKSAIKGARGLVPIFLRRWSEIDRDININVDAVGELSELSGCKTDQVAPVAINWREKPQLKDLPQSWIVSCAIFHNPALMLDDFVACSVITRLDISFNCLKSLPGYIFHMQSLQILNASNNQIEEISSGDIQRSYLSPSLREIDISHNRLHTIPAFVFWLKRLSKIYADSNNILSLPSDIWDCQSLSELKVAHNRLESLPAKRLGRSQIQSRMSDIGSPKGGTALQQKLRGTPNIENRMESRTELQLHDLWALEQSSEAIVDDSVNQNDLTPNTNSLKFIDLSFNKISAVPSGLTCLTPILRTLNLSGNFITTIPRWPADFPPSLHTLNLSKNKIASLSAVSLADSNKFAVLPCANPSPDQGSVDSGPSGERARSSTRIEPRRIRSRSCDRRKGSDSERRMAAFCSHRQHTSLIRLRSLNISGNGMISFNFDHTTAPGITQLDLSSNRMTVLPQAVAHLQNLSVLNISNTMITSLPPEISLLNRLWSIEISNCPLTGELGNLAKGKVRTADIIYHLRTNLDRARLRPVMRMLVCGFPRSGKSSLIESLRKVSNNVSAPPSQGELDFQQVTFFILFKRENR